MSYDMHDVLFFSGAGASAPFGIPTIQLLVTLLFQRASNDWFLMSLRRYQHKRMYGDANRSFAIPQLSYLHLCGD